MRVSHQAHHLRGLLRQNENMGSPLVAQGREPEKEIEQVGPIGNRIVGFPHRIEPGTETISVA
jgi:hypothetical protein